MEIDISVHLSPFESLYMKKPILFSVHFCIGIVLFLILVMDNVNFKAQTY